MRSCHRWASGGFTTRHQADQVLVPPARAYPPGDVLGIPASQEPRQQAVADRRVPRLCPEVGRLPGVGRHVEELGPVAVVVIELAMPAL
jgi:hypothetical protein